MYSLGASGKVGGNLHRPHPTLATVSAECTVGPLGAAAARDLPDAPPPPWEGKGRGRKGRETSAPSDSHQQARPSFPRGNHGEARILRDVKCWSQEVIQKPGRGGATYGFQSFQSGIPAPEVELEVGGNTIC